MSTSSFRVGSYTLTAQDLHPRDGIRWAVGTREGKRSSTWRLWGDKKGDAYLAMRSLGGQLKVSIHRDRRCSVGFTKEFEEVAKERFGADSRHWKRWTLPEAQVVRALQVIIPDRELAHFTAQEADPMAWVPSPGQGKAVVFSIFVAEPPNAFNWVSPEKSGQLLGTMSSKTRFTWVVYSEQVLDAQTLQFIQDYRSKIQNRAAAHISGRRPLRMVLCGEGMTKTDAFFIELDASHIAKEEAKGSALES